MELLYEINKFFHKMILVFNYNILNGRIPLKSLEKLFNLSKYYFVIISVFMLKIVIFLEQHKKGW